MNPRDLLNRWMVPLQTRLDYLSLHSGKKAQVPFEQLVVFATNLDPAGLVDPSFLSRIRHKVKVGDPTPEEYGRVFQDVCRKSNVPYDPEAFDHLLQSWYVQPQRPLRYSHARDIIDQIIDICNFEGEPPCLTCHLIDQACDAYFADL
jgi:hypothetical protein